jgi:hypothetical protein
MVAMAPPAYQGRIGLPTGPLSSVDAWGGAWEAVEDVPCRPCIWSAYGSKKGIRLREVSKASRGLGQGVGSLLLSLLEVHPKCLKSPTPSLTATPWYVL